PAESRSPRMAAAPAPPARAGRPLRLLPWDVTALRTTKPQTRSTRRCTPGAKILPALTFVPPVAVSHERATLIREPAPKPVAHPVRYPAPPTRRPYPSRSRSLPSGLPACHFYRASQVFSSLAVNLGPSARKDVAITPGKKGAPQGQCIRRSSACPSGRAAVQAGLRLEATTC